MVFFILSISTRMGRLGICIKFDTESVTNRPYFAFYLYFCHYFDAILLSDPSVCFIKFNCHFNYYYYYHC